MEGNAAAQPGSETTPEAQQERRGECAQQDQLGETLTLMHGRILKLEAAVMELKRKQASH